MTIRLATQPDNVVDRVLQCVGKERAYIMPHNTERTFGPHVYAITRKESFWCCLLRGKNAPLPSGYITRRQLDELNNGNAE
jgi:hypothetical protein